MTSPTSDRPETPPSAPAPPGAGGDSPGPVCGTARHWIENHLDQPEPAAPTSDGPRHLAPAEPQGRSPRFDRRLLMAAGVVAVVVLVGVALLVVRGSGDDENPADPGPVVVDMDEVAEAAPRLLVTAEGWSVTAADELDPAHGEITSTGPEGEITLTWAADDAGPDYPGYDETLADLTERAERLPDATIAGHEAAVFQTDPAPVFQALWDADGDSTSVAGRFASVDEFLRIAGTLTEVGPSEWLDALPTAATVTSAAGEGTGEPEDVESLRTVDDVLDGVPLPDGFDRAGLDATAAAAAAGEPYDFGVQVLKPVVCAWYERWAGALASGDTVTAGEAADALGTSPSWFALQAMSRVGEWPQQVWTLAGDVGNNTTAGAPDGYVQASVVPVCG